ncbi:DUF3055 domain-containing protein [Brevibacillus fulvus]|uniref:DUF3055 domain-containing protein n=1 Tax=Brevibacillus fulvus TaxID=1125967 RepID=A0A938XYJ8_9BACL|nr:DUF3055 domain-containing protein [Brevibacillus fulvus]MBM7589274.1 hypothetical protein [Brevibacillus fulvus]
MDRFDNLYDVTESAQVRFLGFISENARYDFGIVFTHRFYGKPLVVCMQTGQSTILNSQDSMDSQLLRKVFRLRNDEEAEELTCFFRENLPSLLLEGNEY